MIRPRPLALLLTLSLVACSDDGAPAPDTAVPDTGPGVDAVTDGPTADQPPPAEGGTPDGPTGDTLQQSTEQEPNDGGTTTEYNAIQIPALVKGAIGQADDIDLFGIAAQAGERFTVTVTSDGTLQPHLVVFDPADKLPTAAHPGPGSTVMAEYYPLKSVTILIGVRDRRNVGSSSQHVGGAGFTYTLTVTPLTRAPMTITVGGQQSAALDPPGTVRVFSFSASQSDDLDVSVLTGGSDVDARLSLFHPGQKAWLGTNDDLVSNDALLTGPMPFSGTFHAIVENVAETFGANLGFTLKITKN